MQRIVTVLIGIALLAAPAAAQQRGSAPAKPAAQAQEKDKPKADARPAIDNTPLPVNVRIEITITDTRPDAPAIVKSVTKTVADRSMVRIRTGGEVATKLGFRPVVLNVDSLPRVIPVPGTMTPSNKMRVDITIEYRPVAGEADTEKATTPTINESLTVILEDGKSMLISESADPVTDRKVKVEAKATILR
jgi:glucose/arabinose dehydrogenase